MLILPMLFETFQSPKPENRIFRRYALDGHGNVKRACMAAENVDVAASHCKMLAVLVLGPRGRPWRDCQVRASAVEKVQRHR
jgi:hypothetical protein